MELVHLTFLYDNILRYVNVFESKNAIEECEKRMNREESARQIIFFQSNYPQSIISPQ